MAGFRLRRTLAVLVLGSSMLVASTAASEEVDPARKSAARQIGFEGVKAYEAGRYQEAHDKLERAYALVKAPTLGLWSARAMVKLERWVGAAERYLEASRLSAGGDEKQERAKQEAKSERDALLPRIPSLTISIKGAPAGEVRVTLDGKEVPAALVGASQPIDPGKHQLVGEWRGQRKQAEVALGEAEKREITLEYAPSSAGAATSPGQGEAPAGAEPSGEPASVGRDESAGGVPALAWVAFGVGAVGLAAGGTFGVLAIGKKSDLEDSGHCRDGECEAAVHDDVDTLDTYRTISTVGFVVGAVGIGAGIGLVLGAPKAEARSVSVLASPNGIRVRGSF